MGFNPPVSLPRKTILIHKVIISASASLSGGPAKKERKLRLKKKLKKKYFSESFNSIRILTGYLALHIHFLALLLSFLFTLKAALLSRAWQERHYKGEVGDVGRVRNILN
ncbi:hypothetical protein [Methanosarcina mazei]|uniref:Uncharacterized protein n=1 Tax=Methanosarcina mazei TaxID=2209 RepID=A0A0F8IK64_METMZ|nr:hypothetical protein [Methanosarcina mazei]KKG79814.1 hypothetical protein DU55_13150 [Methanosarcina mazei]